jgi:DNA replication protein DnaC
MSFSRKCIILVNDEFEAKRLENENKRQLCLNEIYSKIPEIILIDKELSQTGVSIMGCAISGKENYEENIQKLRERNLSLQSKRAELLIAHGYASDYTDLKYDCPICQDWGAINGKICSCYKARLIEEQFKLSGISSLAKSQSFETFSLDYYENKDEMSELLAYAKNYVDDFDKIKDNVLFVGGTGLGKTHLSTAIAGALIKKGYGVVYETAQNIFFDFENDRFLDRFGGDEPTATKYLDCDSLIIDDLGAENINAFSVSCLYNIINTRLNKKLPIIASTNFSSKEIRAKYHDRITSRLFSDFTIKMLKGTDIRRLKKQ